jgi:dihydrolipoamide dehydrogenase
VAERQDLVVIGAGPGGFTAAMRAAQLGGKVTLIEEGHVGGNCMHRACIPTQALMTGARLLRSTRQAGRFGVQVGESRLDVNALHERKGLIIDGLRMGTEELLSDFGVTLVRGRGRLIAPDTVEVGGEKLKTRNIVIATGSIAAPPSIEGVELPGVISSEEAMELRQMPEHIAIINSTPFDLELAQYFRLIGSKVTLIESGPRLLPQADREIAQRLGKLLHDAGITIKRGTAVEAIRLGDDGGLAVVLEGKGDMVTDKVLAARRFPNTAGLGLRQVGVRMAHGSILVDEQMQTSVPGIYAVGDAVVDPMQPHQMWSSKATAEGAVAGEHSMGLGSKMKYDVLPCSMFTQPEIAWVGLTEEQAQARGIEVNVGKIPTAINPLAMILGETTGVIKIISSKKYGKVLGAHIMAPGAADLINAITVAMLAEATVRELMHMMPAHPSIGEALVDAAMDVEKRSLHLPKWT